MSSSWSKGGVFWVLGAGPQSGTRYAQVGATVLQLKPCLPSRKRNMLSIPTAEHLHTVNCNVYKFFKQSKLLITAAKTEAIMRIGSYAWVARENTPSHHQLLLLRGQALEDVHDLDAVSLLGSSWCF